MRRSLCFFISMLFIVALTSACGPSSPGPAQPIPTVVAAVIPTTAQVTQAVPTSTTALSSAAQTTAASSKGCNPPDGWSPYTVKSGDTLFALAKQVNLTPEELMGSNCLASSFIGVGDMLYLPIESCTPSPPEGWRTYVVRSGDTLFSLAATRDTTVTEVKQVNCLVSDSLEVGKQLYLPPLIIVPPPTAPAGAPPPPQVPPCPSALSCPSTAPSTALPVLALAPGGGNDSTFTPCAPNDANRIQASSFIIELGERRYFFACNFPSAPVSAAVILSNGYIQPVSLLDPLTINRDIITSTVDKTPTGDVEYRAQAVIEWAAIPLDATNQPTGTHTLIITDSSGKKEERQFLVKLPTKKHILVLPHADAPGTTFQVYYVNFDLNTNATFELYGEDQPSSVRGQHTLTYRSQWTIPITKPLTESSDMGWAQAPLVSASTDLRVAYSISHNQNEIYTLFWLK